MWFSEAYRSLSAGRAPSRFVATLLQGLGCLADPAGVERTLLQTNTAYRWFLGFGYHTEMPHFTTFGKNAL
ncbi:transposase [Bacillus sp. FJAT-49731]|nr:transposase [Lederbergia citrea]MBS4203932.1 transposase [Lederbergia citrea]